MFGRAAAYAVIIVSITGILIASYASVLRYTPVSIDTAALLMHAPRLTTDVWAVFDPVSGEITYGNRITDALPIASITKLFTAYSVLSTKSGGVTTTVTWADLATEGQSGKLSHSETLSLYQLLFPLLIESSNDAGAVISRTLGTHGNAVIEDVISNLALQHTSVVESTGLSAANVSSPADLARFYAYLRGAYPHIVDITKLHMYLDESRGLINNNPLRTMEGFGSGKHGYTPEANRTFVGTIRLSPEREIGIVLLQSSNLVSDAREIMAALK